MNKPMITPACFFDFAANAIPANAISIARSIPKAHKAAGMRSLRLNGEFLLAPSKELLDGYKSHKVSWEEYRILFWTGVEVHLRSNEKTKKIVEDAYALVDSRRTIGYRRGVAIHSALRYVFAKADEATGNTGQLYICCWERAASDGTMDVDHPCHRFLVTQLMDAYANSQQ